MAIYIHLYYLYLYLHKQFERLSNINYSTFYQTSIFLSFLGPTQLYFLSVSLLSVCPACLKLTTRKQIKLVKGMTANYLCSLKSYCSSKLLILICFYIKFYLLYKYQLSTKKLSNYNPNKIRKPTIT